MERATVCLLLLVGTLLLPVTAAQGPSASPVRSCSQECTPRDISPGDPRRGDEPARVILFAHFHDLYNDAPLSTLGLDDPCAPRIDDGFFGPAVTAQPIAGFGPAGFKMFLSGGDVRYDQDSCGRHEQDGGPAEDFEIASREVVLYFYLSANAAPADGGPPGPALPAAGVVPHLALRVRMEAGYRGHPGALIAEADTGKDDALGLAGSGARANVITTSDGEVYEFIVPMTVKHPRIHGFRSATDLATLGFTVSVTPYQVAATDELAVTQNGWRLRSSAEFPPRLVFDATRPLVTHGDEDIPALTRDDGRMYVRWRVNSPFGNRDIDDETVSLSIVGPDGRRLDPLAAPLVRINRFEGNHNGHLLPAEILWQFNPSFVKLADGEYAVRMAAENRQHTYRTEEEHAFQVADGDIVWVPFRGRSAPKDLDVPGRPIVGSETPDLGGGWVALILLASPAFPSLRQRRKGSP